jgi:hypothetical protein
LSRVGFGSVKESCEGDDGRETHERSIGDGSRSRLESSVEKVAQTSVLGEVGLLELVEVAAEGVGVELEAGSSSPDGELQERTQEKICQRPALQKASETQDAPRRS